MVPVTLPPGWARFVTIPAATASWTGAITIGIVLVARFAAIVIIGIKLHQLGSKRFSRRPASWKVPVFDFEILTLDILGTDGVALR
jgi:hypothetical protein